MGSDERDPRIDLLINGCDVRARRIGLMALLMSETVHGMAKRHGAEIQIDSILGEGTTVRLIFAVVAEAARRVESEAPPMGPICRRLLLVDDDPLLLKSLRDTLEADGHDIETAHDGQTGIDVFRAALDRNERFAAVITDLGMHSR